jgi:precorrin-2 methylase
MIWALLAAYFLGGGLGGVNGSLLTTGAIDVLSEQAEIVLDSSTRAAAAQRVLKELRKEIRAFERSFAKSGRKLNKSYKDHSSTQEYALTILSDLNSDWEAMQLQAIDLRFELRDQMTEEEWGELFR